jgi:hypothetical protein
MGQRKPPVPSAVPRSWRNKSLRSGLATQAAGCCQVMGEVPAEVAVTRADPAPVPQINMDSDEQVIQRAIATISQSDPLTKLLEQVKLGRMKPIDAGLRAVTDSWLGTYQKVIDSGGLTRQALRRIDPNPRVAILIECGVLAAEQQAVTALRTSFERAVAAATE